MTRTALLALSIATIALTAPAEARPNVRGVHSSPMIDVGAIPAYPAAGPAKAGRQLRRAASPALAGSRRAARSPEARKAIRRASNGEIAVSTPRDLGGRSGSCLNFRATSRLWCGCFAADEVGLDNRDGHWNLAANYFGLPRATPAFNMVAVRGGHVAVLKSQVSGSIWLAADGNSGGQRARLHEIDLRRFRAVVDPHGARSSRTFAAVRRHKVAAR